MKTKRVVWTVLFLSVTLAAIVMEVIAGVFHPAGTIPWTEYLARYVPWPFQLLAYVVLAVWLPFHFWRHDHLRKAAFAAGVREGQQAARAHYAAMLHVQARSHAATELRPGLAKAAQWLVEDGRPATGGPVRSAVITVLMPGDEVRGQARYEPKCSHGYVFGSPESHLCGELPSDAKG